MRNLILAFIFTMGFLTSLSSQVDSTYWQYADGILETKDHPDSLVGFDWTKIQVKSAYNLNTGDLYSLNPADTSWIRIATITNVSDSINRVQSLSISSSNLIINQSNGPAVSTNLASYVGAIIGTASPTGTSTPQYAGKIFIDTVGVDSTYIATGTTAADWILISP